MIFLQHEYYGPSMVGLNLKFHSAGLIRSMLNNALFRVEEVQDKEERRKKEERKKKKKYDFKHTLASWSGLELARACAIVSL